MSTIVQAPRRPLFANAWLWFVLVLLVVLAGFWPSFFSRPGQNPLPHLLHGTVCTLWLVLLVAQAGLMRAPKLAWHRALGKSAYVLMPLVIATGAWVLHLMLAGQTRLPPPLRLTLGFIDLGTLTFLALAFTLAMVNRRDVQRHARWLATTALVVLPPATTRFVFLVQPDASIAFALNVSYFALEAVTLLLIANDWRSGRMRLPFVAALAYLASTHASLGSVAQWPAWQWLAGRIGGM